MGVSVPQGNSIMWDTARSYAKNHIYVFPVYVGIKPDGKKDPRYPELWGKASTVSLAGARRPRIHRSRTGAIKSAVASKKQ